MTKEQIKQYNLTPIANNWFISQQGLVFVEGDCERTYLAKVFKMNEIDERNNKIKEDCLKILARVKNENIKK